MTGRIHSIETFGTLDGPGVRCVIFMQGCPLRCRYCHNPDTRNPDAGIPVNTADLVRQTLRYRSYFEPGGGVTLSGGEPLLQAEFAAELLESFRLEGLHTAIDTSGCVFNHAVEQALSHTNLVLLDIKHVDDEAHRGLTGTGCDAPRMLLTHIREKRIPYWVRSVIVPGWNDTCEYARRLADYLAQGGHAPERIELAAFHRMGMAKWRALGLVSPLEDTPEPDPHIIRAMEAVLREAGLPAVSQAT